MTYGDDGLQHMLLNGQDVTTQIRLPEISTSHVQRALTDLRSEGVIEVSGSTNTKPILLRMATAEEVGQ